MTDLTGKLIANTYKDLLTVDTSTTNTGLDNNLRKVQDGAGNSSSLKLSQTEAAFTGNVSVKGNLTIQGTFQPNTINTTELQATDISATNITTNTLNAGTLTFQDVSVSTLRAGDVSATTINGTNITVSGDPVITSAVAASVQAIFRAQIATTLANTSAALQQNINVVSVGLSATNTQTLVNATQINTLSTSITTNSNAITSINAILGDGSTYASAGTSATLESRIASTSAALTTNINTVSATLSSTNVALQTSIAAVSALTKTNLDSITSINTILGDGSVYASAGTSAALETRINSVSVLAETKASAGTSAALETRINSVSALAETKASAGTSASLETRIAAVSSTMATSIANVSALTKTNLDAITSINSILGDGSVYASAGTSASLETRIASVSSTMATSIATRLPLAGGTMTGSLVLNGDPSANLQAATKAYVDNLTASSIHIHEAVRVETNSTNLNATYNNGSSGVGATLTNAGTQAALVIDGVTVNTNDRVLVLAQTNQTQNGVYVVTNTGSASTNWVLTRSDDADTAGDGSPDTLDEGSYFFVQEGNVGAAHSFVCNTQGTITFGTTNITFAQFSDSVEYTAGTGINISDSRVISVSAVASAGTSATLETRINAVSVLAETKASAATSANLETRINAVSAITKTNADAITSINTAISAGAYASAGTSATLETRINTVSALVPTSLTELNISDGTNGQVLQTDGSSNFTFVSIAGGGGSGTVTNIKAGTNISMTEAGTTVTETTTSATIAVTASPSFSAATITGDLTVDTNTLYVDSTNNRVGIGSSNPDKTLVVSGSSGTEIVINDSDATPNPLLRFREGGSTSSMISTSSQNLIFSVPASERMRIDSSGNVLVGKTSTSSALTTAGVDLRPEGRSFMSRSGGPSLYLSRTTSDGNIVEFYKDGTAVGSIGSYSGTGLTIASGGELRFFTSTSNEDMRLETDGDLHVDGNVVAYSTTISDIRLKKDIAPIEDAVYKVKQLNGCTFTYLKDDRKSAGLIAQDVEKVLPSAVIEDEAVFHGEKGETYKTVQYDQVIGLLVEAVKELSARVEELENGSS